MIVSGLLDINETILFYNTVYKYNTLNNYDLMPAIALLAKESLSWLLKVVTTPRNIEYIYTLHGLRYPREALQSLFIFLGPFGLYNQHLTVTLTFKDHWQHDLHDSAKRT